MLFETVLSWYRDLFMAAIGNPQFINEDYARELGQTSHFFSIRKAKKALQLILQARQHVELNANPRLILEVLFLNLRKTTAEADSLITGDFL